jgi:outer membrane protein OmpA-like peptidoglycan-associated protein
MSKKENFWIPYADLMTVLMVIFLFISLAYMGVVQLQKKQQDEIFEEYRQTKEALYSELDSTFRDDFKKWKVEFDNDLSIKFNNPQVLFDAGSDFVKDSFQVILINFVPKYLAIVMQDKYVSKIGEIRIEGHTDTKPTYKTDDPYIDNVILSQNRALEVLKFFRKQPCFVNLSETDKLRLQFWLTANGLSYGRTMDKDNQLTYLSKQITSEELSRRVEFKIVTTSETLVDKVLLQMKK